MNNSVSLSRMAASAVVGLSAAMVTFVAGIPSSDAGGACYSFVRSDAQRVIVRRESHGNPHAQNPRSSAFGCGQLLTATRVVHGRRLGIDPNTRHPAEQMRLMSSYIDDRYGSDWAALAHKNRTGWY